MAARFLAARFGVDILNMTEWRCCVTGDLTSAPASFSVVAAA
jgi:phospholipase C